MKCGAFDSLHPDARVGLGRDRRRRSSAAASLQRDREIGQASSVRRARRTAAGLAVPKLVDAPEWGERERLGPREGAARLLRDGPSARRGRAAARALHRHDARSRPRAAPGATCAPAGCSPGCARRARSAGAAWPSASSRTSRARSSSSSSPTSYEEHVALLRDGAGRDQRGRGAWAGAARGPGHTRRGRSAEDPGAQGDASRRGGGEAVGEPAGARPVARRDAGSAAGAEAAASGAMSGIAACSSTSRSRARARRCSASAGSGAWRRRRSSVARWIGCSGGRWPSGRSERGGRG